MCLKWWVNKDCLGRGQRVQCIWSIMYTNLILLCRDWVMNIVSTSFIVAVACLFCRPVAAACRWMHFAILWLLDARCLQSRPTRAADIQWGKS